MQPGPRIGRFLGALALPTFALALGISVLTTYAPFLLGETTSSAGAIGIAIGAEGAFALFLPLLVGSLSDRTQTRFGRRIPYALVGVPLLAAPLVIFPFAHGYAEAVALVSLFFVGYHVYYPPYQALFADLVPASHQGRALGWQGVMRGLGLGVALIAGGLLLTVWTPLPFLLAAAAAVLATVVLVREVGGKEREAPVTAVPSLPGPGVITLVRERADVRAFVVANALWELSFMGLKTFIVLFVVKGLGESMGTASAVIGVVAGAYVIAAFGAGRLADAVGVHRLMRISLWVYGLGLLVGAGLGSLDSFLIGLPFIALAGAVVMTLPYGILVGITPPGAEGALSGLFGFSRALGAVLGPIVVGVAIDVLAPLFPSTSGYGAMWIAIGAPILISLPFLNALRAEEPEPVVELEQPVTVGFDDLALAA
jgi:maltose/moltooligosaccharide transporter